MTTFKMIDVESAEVKLKTYIERTEKQLKVVKDVIEALQPMEGKKISHHIAKALSKKFPELSIDLHNMYSNWRELSVKSTGFDEIRLNLGYSRKTEEINIDEIVHLNQRYLLDEERLVQYHAKLSTIKQDCAYYNHALTSLNSAQELLEPIMFVVTNNDTAYFK